MFQRLFRLCMWTMEHVYVWIDARVKKPVDKELLGIYIDDDFASMTRRQLCNHAESRFSLEKDAMWNLQSTSKIRLACQLARNMKKEVRTK